MDNVRQQPQSYCRRAKKCERCCGAYPTGTLLTACSDPLVSVLLGGPGNSRVEPLPADLARGGCALQSYKETMRNGMDSFARRIQQKKVVYEQVVDYVAPGRRENDRYVRITDKDLFCSVLENFATILVNDAAEYDLSTLYDVGFHLDTGALIISNKGATLFCHSPRTQTPYLSKHIGCCVYLPGLGVEVANVAMVGNVYDGPVVLRSESACTPSFLFGSQRCNCAHQWETIRELAAWYNPATPPAIESGRDFEQWVQQQYECYEHRHLPATAGQGLVMIHVDTQNGMGSGYTNGEFSFDLFSRASLRHRGEYSAEQIHQTTMAGGFTAIGIKPDPRSESNEIGYKITSILLDWLQISRDLVFLSNNKAKIRQLESAQYKVRRVKTLGTVNAAGAQEAEERGTEFGHMDIGPSFITFEQEMSRLVRELAAELETAEANAKADLADIDFTPCSQPLQNHEKHKSRQALKNFAVTLVRNSNPK